MAHFQSLGLSGPIRAAAAGFPARPPFHPMPPTGIPTGAGVGSGVPGMMLPGLPPGFRPPPGMPMPPGMSMPPGMMRPPIPLPPGFRPPG